MLKIHKNFKRFIFPGAVYYVVIKTKDNFPYFKEKIFCESFIEDLKICKDLKKFKLYGFSLIYDHINLLIEPNDKSNLSDVIKSLKRNVTRNNNIIMGYTDNFCSEFVEFVGATSLSRLQIPQIRVPISKALHKNFPQKDITFYKNLFNKKHQNNPYPKFAWQKSFYDHYIRFHENHLKRQKEWDYHYEYTVYNHLKHNLPENWQYASIKYPELINSMEL